MRYHDEGLLLPVLITTRYHLGRLRRDMAVSTLHSCLNRDAGITDGPATRTKVFSSSLGCCRRDDQAQ